MSEQNKDLIAYCGLYCGDCINYKGEIADLARDLRKKLREGKFDRVSQGLSSFLKEFKNYEQCYEVLGGMVRLRCKKACRGGGAAAVGDVEGRGVVEDAREAGGHGRRAVLHAVDVDVDGLAGPKDARDVVIDAWQEGSDG